MSKALTDEQLCAAAKAGDDAALGQLLLNHYERLQRHLSQKLPASLRRVQSADDILQNTLADAFRNIDEFEYRGPGSFYVWLKVIAEHRLRDAIKSHGRKKRGGDGRQIDANFDANKSALELFDLLCADKHTASQSIARREAAQILHIAIAELPNDYRDVIRLRYLEGKSIEEASKALGRSPASIRSLADRAKKKLRETLAHISLYMSSR